MLRKAVSQANYCSSLEGKIFGPSQNLGCLRHCRRNPFQINKLSAIDQRFFIAIFMSNKKVGIK